VNRSFIAVFTNIMMSIPTSCLDAICAFLCQLKLVS
jgi:hypothetical protein